MDRTTKGNLINVLTVVVFLCVPIGLAIGVGYVVVHFLAKWW